MNTAINIINKQYKLGECPLWDERINRLYFIDIESRLLCYIDPQMSEPVEILLPRKPGTVVLSENPNTIFLLLQNGLYKMNLLDSSLDFINGPRIYDSNYRFNDGKCDAYGNIYVGSMHDIDPIRHMGFLYRIDHKGTFHPLECYHIPNGMVWSTNSDHYYIIDSIAQMIYRYQVNPETGVIFNREPWISFADEIPDGMTLDNDGNAYIAHWNGAKVSKWHLATKEKKDEYLINALKVTSCVFGGNEFKDLYVTTSSLESEHMDSKDESGSVFLINDVSQGARSNYYNYYKHNPLLEG